MLSKLRLVYNILCALEYPQTESAMDCSFPNMAMPVMWPEIQMNGDRQQFQQQWHFESLNQLVWAKEEDQHNLVTSENSLLTYDSSANSGICFSALRSFALRSVVSHDMSSHYSEVSST